MTLLFAAIAPTHMDWFRTLNNNNIPAVNKLSENDLENLLAQSDLSLAACESSGLPLGGVITLSEDQNYQSDNYKWYQENYDDFLYIDRVIIDDAAIGQGVGSALYDRIFEHASEKKLSSIVCEINEVPPNPESMAFHEALGFKKIASRFNADQGKHMAMMRRDI